MAGIFGYEMRNYELSLQIVERGTWPAVRPAGGDTPLICDGYSCNEQIRLVTGKPVPDLGEVLQHALRRCARDLATSVAGMRRSSSRKATRSLPAADRLLPMDSKAMAATFGHATDR